MEARWSLTEKERNNGKIRARAHVDTPTYANESLTRRTRVNRLQNDDEKTQKCSSISSSNVAYMVDGAAAATAASAAAAADEEEDDDDEDDALNTCSHAANEA